MTSLTLPLLSARGFTLAAFTLCVATSACSSAPDYPEQDLAGDIPRHYQAPFVSDAPLIDGSLDDLAWRKAKWTANFVAIGGSKTSRPRHQSRAKMLWNREYLYIGVWMVEPSLKSESLSTLSADGLMLFVSGDGKSGAYHLILTEPGGSASTSTFNMDTGRAPLREIVGMQHGVALSGTLNDASDGDQGWWAEFALPWSSLTSSAQASVPHAGAEWRVNFVREEQAWSPYFEHELHDAELWGKVELVR
jgi:hypothetical protein